MADVGVPRLSAERPDLEYWASRLGPDHISRSIASELAVYALRIEGEREQEAVSWAEALVVERERAEQYADKGADLVMELAEMRERVREAEMEAAQLGRSYDEVRERAERLEQVVKACEGFEDPTRRIELEARLGRAAPHIGRLLAFAADTERGPIPEAVYDAIEALAVLVEQEKEQGQ